MGISQSCKEPQSNQSTNPTSKLFTVVSWTFTSLISNLTPLTVSLHFFRTLKDGMKRLCLVSKHAWEPADVAKGTVALLQTGSGFMFFLAQLGFWSCTIWRFPKMVVPLFIIHLVGFSTVNHPFWGILIVGNYTIVYNQCSCVCLRRYFSAICRRSKVSGLVESPRCLWGDSMRFHVSKEKHVMVAWKQESAAHFIYKDMWGTRQFGAMNTIHSRTSDVGWFINPMNTILCGAP